VALSKSLVGSRLSKQLSRLLSTGKQKQFVQKMIVEKQMQQVQGQLQLMELDKKDGC
jgi:hypothetical protein